MTETSVKNPIDRRILTGIAFIAVSTILVYLPAITGEFIWDDPDYVVNNHTLRDLQGLVDMWTVPRSIPQWYPLVHTTFWIEYHLWGLNPIGYHIVNVVLHITGALLLWRLLLKLEVPGAWLAGAIFALHPVHAESVAWITERKNVLSAVFALLSLLSYLRYLNSRADLDKPLEIDQAYVLSLVLFVMALLSKSVTATLPGVIGVIIWWKRGRLNWRDLVPLVPFVLIGAASGLYTAYIEKYYVGASDSIPELNLSFSERFLLAGRIIWFYVRKLLIPWPLVFIYPQWMKPDPGQWWQWMFPISVIVALASLVLSARRFGRGPAAAGLIFCGSLFPALGFLNVYPMRFSYVADHFQYHASTALIALAAAGLCRYAGKVGWGVLVPLLALTALRTPVYHNPETLWRDTFAKNPNSWMVNTNLAHVYRARGDETGDERWYDEADQYYFRALELAPEIYDTHANVGMAYGRRGDDENALRYLNQTLVMNPHFAPAYYSIGQIYQRQGKFDLAMANYYRAVEILPTYPEANFRLGLVLEQTGNLPGAIERYRVAVTYQPEHVEARYNLGGCLLRVGLFSEAAGNLLEAVRIRPNWAEAWANLGAAQLKLNRPNDAIRSFEKALSIKPDLQPAQAGLRRAREM